MVSTLLVFVFSLVCVFIFFLDDFLINTFIVLTSLLNPPPLMRVQNEAEAVSLRLYLRKQNGKMAFIYDIFSKFKFVVGWSLS